MLKLLMSGVLSIAMTQMAFAQSEAAAPPPPPVTVVPATLQAVAQTATFTGRIEAVQHVDVLARVAGFVEKIDFSEGQSVSKGDLLFQIEPDAYEAAVTQIKGQIKAAESAKTLADIELDRQKKLYASDTVAESVVQHAEAQQGKSIGELQQLQGSLQAAELNLSYTKITAAFDGRVGLTSVSAGAFVGPESGPLVMLSSIDPIYVTFPIAEADFLRFRKHHETEAGDTPVEVRLIMADGSEYEQSGKVAVIDTTVQQGTDTILLRAEFPNADGILIDGQLVRTKLIDQSQEQSLTIPVQALQRDQAGYFVLIVGDDNKVVKQTVQVARTAGTIAVIREGLAEGDKVITQGSQRARPGLEVAPQLVEANPAPAAPAGQAAPDGDAEKAD